MEAMFILIGIIAVSFWLWISILSILCLFLDPDLEPIQRWGQMLIVILIPYFGASIILKLVNDHSPEVIDRFYIPWPFRNLVLDKPLRHSGSGHNREEVPGSHSGSLHGGSGSGGSGSD
jgi:uncharacterized membrane protein YgcG